MKKYLFILVLILIIGLGLFLRVYKLSSVPVALNGDEAGFGYNAYAILTTGRDEHGQFLPDVFKSFGDYKPPIFVYMLVPLVYIFGLTELTVRMPIAILSTILIVITYLIARELFKSKWISLVSAFLISISAWAIQFSRAGWEASLGLFFTTLGIYLFLIGLRNFKWFWGSAVVFVLAFYSYHAEKLAVPLLIITLLLIFKPFKAFTKKNILLLVFLIIASIPALIGITNFSGQSRARGSLIIDYLFSSTKDNIYKLSSTSESSSPVDDLIWHSRVANSITDISSKLFAYISPANLFVYGDEVGRHSSEGFGVLYPYEFVLLLSAIYFFIKSKKTKYDLFLIAWILIGTLPAMITKDKLHSIRSLLALPPIYIFEAWGLIELLKAVRRFNRRLVLPVLVVFLIGSLIYLIHFFQSYFIFTPVSRANWWQYGYKEMVLTVAQNQDRFDNVVVDSPKTYGNPYIFFLFYQKYDANKYNQQVIREDDLVHKVVPVYSFGKYKFREVYWPDDRSKSKTLFVGTEMSIPKQDLNDPQKFKLIKEITDPKGDVVFRIVETL